MRLAPEDVVGAGAPVGDLQNAEPEVLHVIAPVVSEQIPQVAIPAMPRLRVGAPAVPESLVSSGGDSSPRGPRRSSDDAALHALEPGGHEGRHWAPRTRGSGSRGGEIGETENLRLVTR